MENTSNLLDFLNRVIATQSLLAKADFNLENFMKLIVEQMEILTPATGVVVELLEGDEMIYRAASGTVAHHIGLRLPMASSLSGLCVRKNRLLISDDTEKDSRVNIEACRKVNARSLIVAPLVYQGNPMGVLKIIFDKPKGYRENDIKTVLLMAGFIASGVAHQIFYETNQKLLEERTKALNELQLAKERLEYLAHNDALTGLPNRRSFSNKLLASIVKINRSKKLMAILFFDIDYFKSINDNLGHEVGDHVLKIFAERIKFSIRRYDFAARLGGDEFIVLLDELSNPDDAINIAEKIIINVQEKINFEKNNVFITTSIGITFYQGKNTSTSPDVILKQADLALYSAKKAGRNTYKIHDLSEKTNGNYK